MILPDAYEFFHLMNDSEIIFSFRGAVTERMMSSMYTWMDETLTQTTLPADRQKKFYHVMVECLQNVYHHQDDGSSSESILLISGSGSGYRITTGNVVRSSRQSEIVERIKRVNAMSPDQLREHYREGLDNREISEKGGAGLGFTDMARKSGKPLEYSFEKMNDDFSFFTFSVII